MVTSSKELEPEKDYAGECQQHIPKTDPSSRQRGRPTKTGPQLSESNKYLVMNPRWGSTPRLTDLLIFSRNVTLTLRMKSVVVQSRIEIRMEGLLGKHLL
jgi:hypothetical protein